MVKKRSRLDTKIIFLLILCIATIAYFLYTFPEEKPGIIPYCGDGTCQATESCSSCPSDCGSCPQEPTVEHLGTLIVALKDVQHKLPTIGTVTALDLTISSIKVHKANESNESWITVFEGSKEIDLLLYTDVIAIVGEEELEVGKYTQIRLEIENASINITNPLIGIYKNKTYPMSIPSKELKLIHPFTVEENKTLVLTLDFDVEKSIIRAPEYMLKPVIKILEESLEEEERPENSVIV